MSMEIDQILDRQRKFFLTGATLSVDLRIQMLKKLRRTVQKNEKRIAAALKADLGKSDFESYMCETGLVMAEISYMIGHARRFAAERRVSTPLAQSFSRSYKKPSPYGNTLIMSPWNYPFLLTMDPLADAIAAGNTAVVKPSAYSPATGAVIKKILSECFPPEYVAVVTGAGTYIYNGNGALLNSCLSSYRTPQTKTAGGKLLTYDLGGNGLRVDNKAKNLYTTTATGTLLAADIAPTGAIATVQSAPGVYAQVSAYNPRFELMYTWMVQDSYITGVSLSNRGGMMACAGLTMEGQHLVSLLRIHHFDQDEEVARVSLSDQLIVSMVWNDVDEIQVVTNRNLYLFSSEGEQLAMSPLPGELLTYENVSGGIYVAYGDYRDPAGVTVLSYTDDLEQAGSASLDRRLISITSDGNHVLILTEGQLYLGDPALRELKLRSHSDLYMVCPVGSSIYGVSPDGLIHTLL